MSLEIKEKENKRINVRTLKKNLAWILFLAPSSMEFVFLKRKEEDGKKEGNTVEKRERERERELIPFFLHNYIYIYIFIIC